MISGADAVPLLEAIIEATSDGILVIDNKGIPYRHNQNFIKIWNIPEEMVSSSQPQRFLEYNKTQVKDPEDFIKKIEEFLKNPRGTYQDMVELKDGRILERLSIPHVVNDVVIGKVLFFRDVTQRLKKENDIKEKARYREESISLLNAVVEATADGILIVDREGKIVKFNEKFQKMWRIPDYIVQTNDDDKALEFVLDQLSKPEDFLNKVRELYSQPDVSSFDVLEFKDGRVFERFSNPQVIGPHIVGRVWSFRDVTQKVKIEKMLNEKTISLHRSNEELSQMASVLSHDLKEPLRSMASFLSLLERRFKGRLDPEADTYISYAVNSAERLGKLIDSLLALARISAPASSLPQVDCGAVFNHVVSDLNKIIQDSVAAVTSDPLPVIAAEEARIHELFLNLISNAIKYRDKNPPRIHVSAERRFGDWMFSVRDNGMGIEEKYRETVFGMFERLSTDREGIGIGLSICKKIVESYGGRIWVESNPGGGSVFYFKIPKKEDIDIYLKKKITVSYRNPGAKSVFLAGDWTGWQQVPLADSGKGLWETLLELTPGLYKYKLIVDGTWICNPEGEPANDHIGNNLLRV